MESDKGQRGCQDEFIRASLGRGFVSFLAMGTVFLFLGWAAHIMGVGADPQIPWSLGVVVPLMFIGPAWGASSVILWNRGRTQRKAGIPRKTTLAVFALQIPNILFLSVLALALIRDMFFA